MCGIIPGYCREMKPPYGMIYHCLVFFFGGGEAGNAEQLWYVYIYIGLFWYGGLRLSTPQMIENWQNGLVLCWNARPHLWVPIGAPSWIHILYRRVIQLPQIQRLHFFATCFPQPLISPLRSPAFSPQQQQSIDFETKETVASHCAQRNFAATWPCFPWRPGRTPGRDMEPRYGDMV